ncbi:rab GDP dissociation inhibitor alpha putative [Ochromonadaceae sp. CCMP2298]|nr:rab GDP dissociation inhibitor alpha putative [Ochromonadaceae sp. CCMP2298]
MSEFKDNEESKAFGWMPAGCEALADGEYDAIIMGTGLTECIISGLLSVNGKRVLHVDRNNYYGADTASLSLTNLFSKFRTDTPGAQLGHSRDWNVDLIPKFIMACGKLVKILLHSKVTRYLEFKSIDGSYVFKDAKVQKVPATPGEALNSSLMGFFEKRKFRNFLLFLSAYEKDKPATYMKGKSLDQMTMRQLYAEFGLDENTQSFTGHAMALQCDDDYLDMPADFSADAIKLYVYSLEKYGKSPYIYPVYGLGGMPEGFSRLCAIHGGTFMLNKGIDEVLFNSKGEAWGVKTGNEVAKAPIIIGDPSYFDPSKTAPQGKVVRSICILDHPIKGTDNAESVQIIIPAKQVGRKNDIYVCMVSYAHAVASANKYICIASTTVETSNPIAELAPAYALIGDIMERFDSVSDLLAPLSDGKADNCYISKSYDATSHFESCANDVLDMYKRITDTELDMNISADMTDEDM